MNKRPDIVKRLDALDGAGARVETLTIRNGYIPVDVRRALEHARGEHTQPAADCASCHGAEVTPDELAEYKRRLAVQDGKRITIARRGSGMWKVRTT